MKKSVVLGALFLLALPGVPHAETGIPPEIPTMVDLSNRDINRVVCSGGEISDMLFSKEKGLTGHFTGNSAYVKFTIEEVNGKRIYAHEPSEMYIVCGGSTYSLIANPVNKQPAIVRLAPPKSDQVTKNIREYKNMPLEKQALKLIREGYEENYPASYKVEQGRAQYYLSPNFKITLDRIVDVDGVGLRLKIFRMVARIDEKVDDRLFLSRQLSDSMVAVATDADHLSRGGVARVFVVESKAKDGPSAMSHTIKDTWYEGGGEE